MSAAQPVDRRERTRLLAEASRFYWYHCVELAPGVVTDGDYDLAPLWSQYGFPDDMSGMDVLDVGRGSGYFAFEFERRGANVVATELESIDDWDWVGVTEGRVKQVARERNAKASRVNRGPFGGAFHHAHAVRRSHVEARTINVYDLNPGRFQGRLFDLVFAGSLASHLRDPILAFARLRSVTRGTCIVAAPSFEIPAVADYPMLSLVGTAAADWRNWWVTNARGLEEALRCAGFSSVAIRSGFRIEHRHREQAVDHLVAHATP
jgi:SAM-dependent methyltransferase